jgi:hypothetical protein
VHDRPCVADELAGEAAANRGGHELRRLELLRDDGRLGFAMATTTAPATISAAQ